MNRRILSVAAVVVSAVLSSGVVYAAPTTNVVAVHGLFVKTKLITFSLRNNTGVALKLKAGDSVMTLEEGKTLSLKLPAGTVVTTEEATTNHPAGSVLTQVSKDISGATLTIR